MTADDGPSRADCVGKGLFMDVTETLRYIAALLLVLGLVGGAALALKRYGLPGIAGGAGKRVKILETLMLGPKHRLLLIRCDTAEHLIVLTPTGATVVGQPATATPEPMLNAPSPAPLDAAAADQRAA